MKNKGRPQRLYYKIGEVCKLVEVEPHVLRYWESEFPQLLPTKNRSGQRTYRARDLEIIRLIKRLLYSEGFTIAGAKKRIPQELRRPAEESAGIQPLSASELPFLETDNPPISDAGPTDGPASAKAKLDHIRSELGRILTLLERTV